VTVTTSAPARSRVEEEQLLRAADALPCPVCGTHGRQCLLPSGALLTTAHPPWLTLARPHGGVIGREIRLHATRAHLLARMGVTPQG
jgi:hypothetical protein